MKRNVILSGALANKAFNGGNAWSRLSWILGLRRLGWTVYFVEEIASTSCVNVAGATASFAESANLAFFRAVVEQFGLGGAAALICDGGKEVYGLSKRELSRQAQEADFLFNFSGHLSDPDLRSCFDCQIYFDDDPGFTQFWEALGNGGARLAGHDFYFTLGANIGRADCPIPTNNRCWRPTRPPVVLERWPIVSGARFDRFTTVASWRGAYGPVVYNGRKYGLKAHEFRKLLDVPERTRLSYEIALQIDAADRKDVEALSAHGWRLVDPRQVAPSPDAFQTYVQASGAEFSAAQSIYVDTNSGWFSDRTVRYLASGRPALIQETGFSRDLPVGEGLLSFRTLAEAVENAERIARNYPIHCRAARGVVEDYFDSDKVIGKFLREIGLPAAGQRFEKA